MPEYRLKWEIDIEAKSAEDAIKEAIRIQRDTESTAVVFDVTQTIDFLKTKHDLNRVCDTCKVPITEKEYQNGKGLCIDCINFIQ